MKLKQNLQVSQHARDFGHLTPGFKISSQGSYFFFFFFYHQPHSIKDIC